MLQMAGFDGGSEGHTNPEHYWQRRHPVQRPPLYLIQLARQGVSPCLIRKLAGFSSEP